MTSVFFQTHGCSANVSESEAMMGLLSEADYKLVDDPEYADVNVLNICTVKGNNVPLREVKKYSEQFPDKKLVVAGCITRDLVKDIRKLNESCGMLNTHNIHRIVDVIEETLQGNALEALTQDRIIKVELPKKRSHKVIGIVPIASGCDDRCAYCSVKLIKGNIYSYPINHIVAEVKKNVTEGCKEIWITSQDNGAYGIDRGQRELALLLKAILNKVSGDYKLRLGMVNPRHVMAQLDELIEVFQDDRMYKFLHIPIEAGNNEVLGKMNRKYTVHDFKDLVDTFRRYVPDITIATDLIVGFPSETELQFQDSLDVIQQIKPDALNIARFSPRPNTPAARMDEQISSNVKKERSKVMTDLFNEICLKNNQRWIGWEGPIVLSEKGKEGQMIGRNFAYRQVIVEGDYNLGDELYVKITDAGTFDIRAEVIERPAVVEKV